MSVIFLDIDGVLRRRNAPFYRLEVPLREAFEALVRGLPEAQVVITSSWREGVTLGEIRRHFSPDVGARIVGTTPIAGVHEGHYRHREVLAYLKRHGLQEEVWVALEDDPEHYPASAPVVMVDPDVGFDSDRAREVRERLAG
jgi:hypothetical protein